MSRTFGHDVADRLLSCVLLHTFDRYAVGWKNSVSVLLPMLPMFDRYAVGDCNVGERRVTGVTDVADV